MRNEAFGRLKETNGTLFRLRTAVRAGRTSFLSTRACTLLEGIHCGTVICYLITLSHTLASGPATGRKHRYCMLLHATAIRCFEALTFRKEPAYCMTASLSMSLREKGALPCPFTPPGGRCSLLGASWVRRVRTQ